MAEERVFRIDISAEVARFFDDSSLSEGEQPRIIVIMGGPASGKTTFRKQQYATGYVVVDAVEIFLHLCQGEFFPFPDAVEEPMQIIGRMVASRATSEKRHIVTELIGADAEAVDALINAMTAIGYHVDLQYIHCDIEEAQRRNLARGDDDISCYYAEPY